MNSLSFGSNRMAASFRFISNVALLIIRNPLTLVSHVPFGSECWRGQDPKILGRDAQRDNLGRKSSRGSRFRSVGRRLQEQAEACREWSPNPAPRDRVVSAARFRLYQRLDRVGGNLLVSLSTAVAMRLTSPPPQRGLGMPSPSHTRHQRPFHSRVTRIASGTRKIRTPSGEYSNDT